MVDFTDFKIGSKIKLKLSDDTTQEYVIVIVDEIEWSLHRHPFLVDLKIESSTDEEKWPLNTKILLSVKLEENKDIFSVHFQRMGIFKDDKNYSNINYDYYLQYDYIIHKLYFCVKHLQLQKGMIMNLQIICTN